MTPAVTKARGSATQEHARAAICERLQERRDEIELAMLNRIYGISDTSGQSDPEYLEGLRNAVAAALDYGLAAIQQGEERPPQIPAVLLVQARMAARLGISLDTVLRRYFAGYALLGDYILEEAERVGLAGGVSIKSLTRAQAALFDRLLVEISEEHSRETEARRHSMDERRVVRLRSLLAGELIDTSEFDYDFNGHHLAVIASGDNVEKKIRDLASSLDRRLLLARVDKEAIWGWLGGRRKLAPGDLGVGLSQVALSDIPLAAGTQAEGISGWRLTHRQAKAALPIALRRGEFVCYSDVALLASHLQDDLLVTSLREIYLKPLRDDRDSGKTSMQTLRAYFTAKRNISSAAATLGVSRRTVANRLRSIEAKLGCPLDTAITNLETALQLEDASRLDRVER